jgi:hypothetical protein
MTTFDPGVRTIALDDAAVLRAGEPQCGSRPVPSRMRARILPVPRCWLRSDPDSMPAFPRISRVYSVNALRRLNAGGCRAILQEADMDAYAKFRSVPRLTPLASCLAAALAIASGTFAPVARSETPFTHSRPVDLDLTAPAGWRPQRAQPRDRDAIEQRWRSVLTREIPHVPANSVPVSNCDDHGSGSLRDAVNSAGDGDTIDMTGLGCSTITLTTGAIAVTQNTLTLQGSGALNLVLDANYSDIALLHDGSGSLYINDLFVEDGRKYFTDAQIDPARGGCIFSSGTVVLSHSSVAFCEARTSSTHYPVLGGGIYAQNGVSLDSSVVAFNEAHADTYESRGGGIYSAGFLTAVNSSISFNDADGGTTDANQPLGGYHAFGGGAFVQRNLIVKYSTIDHNSAATNNGGGIFANGDVAILNSTISRNAAEVSGGLELSSVYATQSLTIRNSTISGNTAYFIGGISANEPTKISNSTIAFNTERSSTKYGAGLSGGTSVELESTIVGNNYQVNGPTPVPDDIGGNASMSLSGADNLVVLSLVTLPSGTIAGQSPKLGSLGYNGGMTETHMLLSGSPAIGAGNNSDNDNYDQRGAGFPRVIGGNADIGAYELDTNDLIFANGFDN